MLASASGLPLCHQLQLVVMEAFIPQQALAWLLCCEEKKRPVEAGWDSQSDCDHRLRAVAMQDVPAKARQF